MTFGKKARRAGWLLIIAVFAFGLASAVHPAPAAAYGLLSTRSIEMSSSEANTKPGGVNVIYNVNFTLATSGQTFGAIVIHFCSNDPIIGDGCTAPAGLLTNYSTLSLNGWTASGITTAPTIDTTNSNNNTVILKEATAATVTGTPTISFSLGNGSSNGFTNPTAVNQTFFARITVYSTTAPTWSSTGDAAGGTNATTEKTATDAGGVALSTAQELDVTAKVQEQLTFCVYTGTNCAGGGGTINMGDANGVLAATNTTYLDSTPKFDLASNALNGVVVRLKGDTLKSGSFSISPDGATCTADSTTTTVSQFGVRVVTYGTGQYNGSATSSTGPTGGTDDFGCLAGNHKFDPTATNTTYGENFVRTFGATDNSTTNFELAAKASSTTPAGVYTTTLQLIATGTY